MSDLVAFLRARLDDEEQAAKRASCGPWVASTVDSVGGGMIYGDDGWHVASATIYPRGIVNSPSAPGYLPAFPTAMADTDANGAHIARWDPARVLAEVAAKRAIITLAFEHEAKIDGECGCCHSAGRTERGERKGTPIAEIELLRVLAQPYAEHPDFDPAWRT